MFKHFDYRSFFVNILQSTFEYLLLFPLYLMYAVYNMSAEMMVYWLLMILGLYFVGVLYRTFFHNHRWFVYGLLSLGVGFSTSLLVPGGWFTKTLLTIAQSIFVYRGMMYTARSRQSLLSTAFLWLGGPVNYFICFFFYYYLAALQPYLLIFSMAGFVTIAVILFMANNDHLRVATLSKDAKPFISQQIKRQNRLFLFITIIIIFIVASLDFIRDIFWRIVYFLRMIIQWILYAGSTSQMGEKLQPSEVERPSIPSVTEGQAAPKFMVFLGIIILYATYVFIFIVLIMLVLLIIKRTRQSALWFIRELIAFLKRLGNRLFMKHEDHTQYIDEKENIFDWDEWRQEQQDKLKHFMQDIFSREPNWEDLSNQEKVRFAYRTLVNKRTSKHYSPSLTPREILAHLREAVTSEDQIIIQKLRKAYEQTRYGDKSIDDQVVQEIYTLIKED